MRRAVTLFFLLLSLNITIKQAEAQPQTKVDIFLLFDETGSFSTFTPSVSGIFSDLVAGLETNLPGVDFAFGVGSFKDYGGPGWDFCSNHSEHCVDDFERRVNGRPFYLHQAIINTATAGGVNQRNTLILEALQRSGPGTGGDDPESHIEALWQLATGLGFDGNGDGSKNGFDGTQTAGSLAAQTTPDQSGDVPAFGSGTQPSAGTFGGAGFRSDALKLVILATEICPALAFPAGSAIPQTVRGRYSEEFIADFACRSTTLGDDRFGYVSNAISNQTNSVPNAVVPAGAATFGETLNVLNNSDIRVISIGPGLTVRASGSGPGHEPSGFLSALARFTGAVDSQGTPLVFDIGSGGSSLKDRLVQAITAAVVINPDEVAIPGAGGTVVNVDDQCKPLDSTVTLDSLNKTLKANKKTALKYLKKTLSSDKYKKSQKKAKKLEKQSKDILQKFPRQALVCSSSNICPAVDHSTDIALLTKSLSGVNKMAASALKKAAKAGLIKNKNSKKQRAKNNAVSQQTAASIATLPLKTFNCAK